MLEFKPEPLNSLKARYKDALLFSYVASPDMKNTPGQNRENIFDFEDGIRLIVSKDIFPHTVSVLFGKENDILHFSASIDDKFFKGEKDAKLLEDMVNKFCELSGESHDKIHFIGFSPGKKIPHWMVK